MPTVKTKLVEKDGFHRRIVIRSYVIVLCEIDGSRVKAVRLDDQTNWAVAVKTALADNEGWKLKGFFTLSDRDFERGKK